MPRLTFVRHDGREHVAEAVGGVSLMEAARALDLVEGACDGSLACATCHVILDDALFAALPPASPEEEDMLDFAPGVSSTSRLGCQIPADRLPDGAVIRLPRG